MAKDRTRHARRRVAERVDVSLFDIVSRDFGSAIGSALADFTDVVSNVVVDAAELCRRLSDGI